MDIKEVIESCIDYIENQVHQKISLDDLAHYTGMSKFHLHRMFKSLTGETLMDYITSRKLSLTLEELINTNKRIIDIAMDYGFEYEQSYIRAFKKKFGYTPLRVRSNQFTLVTREKINPKELLTVNNSVTYKPFFVYKQRFFLVGQKHALYSKSGDNAANAFGREFFYNHKGCIPNMVNPHVYFGYTDWSKNQDGYTNYIPSVEVSDLSNVPKDMTGISVPAQKYVVFRFIGFFRPDAINGRQVGRLLVHMYSRWIFHSGYQFADTYRFEYIDTSLSTDDYCELDIYQPIMEIASSKG